MFIVGLTGGIATGKSTVLSIFRERGIAVVDADEVARQVMQKGTKAWCQLGVTFGEEIYEDDGSINRALLADIVFNDTQKRRTLNAITHPKIQRAMINVVIKYFLKGHIYVVMELPLLFETGKLYSYMHKIITVVCEDHQQLERLCKRNSLTTEAALPRINAQMPLAEKVAKSDFVIDNSSDLLNTKRQTELVMSHLEECKFTWFLRNAAKFVVLPVILGIVSYLFVKYLKRVFYINKI